MNYLQKRGVIMNSISNMSTSTKIKWLITIAVTLIVYLIPTGEVYTKQMSLFFTVTVFALFLMAFEFFEPLVVAIIMPAAWIATGATNVATAMSGWTNTIVYMVVGSYFLANALGESGLLKRIALWIIYKCGGKWTGLLFGIFIAGIVISIATFGQAYILMATLCFGIVKSLGLKFPSKAGAMIFLACTLGTCSSRCFIYSPATFAILIGQAQVIDPSFDITAIEIMTHNFPMFIVSVITLLLVSKFWKTGFEMESSSYFKDEIDAMGPISISEKKSAVFLVIFFAVLLSAPITGVDANLLFALAPWLLLLPGINVATEKSIRELNWQMIFFVSSCMAIGTVASALGIGQLISAFVTPIMEQAGTMGFYGITFALTFILNFFMTPLAIWSLMSGPLCEIALNLGINMQSACYALVMCSEAIILPYEYVPYLVCFSFGMISMVDFVKVNIVRCILYLIGFMCLQIPWWIFLGIV